METYLIDGQMPLWWQTIQIIGWVELFVLFLLLPFERRYEFLYKANNIMPNNFLGFILIVVAFGTPIIFAGIISCLLYFVFIGGLYLSQR